VVALAVEQQLFGNGFVLEIMYNRIDRLEDMCAVYFQTWERAQLLKRLSFELWEEARGAKIFLKPSEEIINESLHWDIT
jgi:hypothetical protein